MIRIDLEEGKHVRSYAISDLSDVRVTGEIPVKNQWYIVAATTSGLWCVESKLHTYVSGSTRYNEKTKMPELHLDERLILVRDGQEYIDQRKILDFGKFDLRKEIEKQKRIS